MSDDILRKQMEMLYKNSHYGLLMGTDCDYDIFNSPPPPIYIGPVKIKTLKERLEETKMNSTSTQTFKDIIAIDFELQTFPDPDTQDKFIVSATNRDDIFCLVFEGPHIANACRNAGLFGGWEKDQKIKELEEELGRWKKKASDCLKLRDEAQKEAYKLKQQLQKAERDKKSLAGSYERLDNCYKGLLKDNKNLIKCKESLKSDLDLEREANEAQRKFIKEYAGKDTEVTFNYAIDSVPITYGLYDKDYIDELRKEIHSLKVLKTPTIENFADEEPSDNVNHPSHYNGRYECIDVMQDVFGDEATDNFCLCNAFKYIWRANKKNGLEDVKKAVWYLTRYIEEAENGVRKGEQV